MAGMTIVEKIFARNSGQDAVKPGDIVIVDVDVAVMLDMSFLATERHNILKVHNPDKIAVIFDHMVPAADKRFGRGARLWPPFPGRANRRGGAQGLHGAQPRHRRVAQGATGPGDAAGSDDAARSHRHLERQGPI